MVLLIQRGKDPMKGVWSLPGGALDLGETVVEAVITNIKLIPASCISKFLLSVFDVTLLSISESIL